MMKLVAAAVLALVSVNSEQDPSNTEMTQDAREHDEQLGEALEELIHVSRVSANGDVFLSHPPGGSRYLEPGSGHYWQISGEGFADFTSRSLGDRNLSLDLTTATGLPQFYNSNQFQREPLRVVVRSAQVPGSNTTWVFAVARKIDVGR